MKTEPQQKTWNGRSGGTALGWRIVLGVLRITGRKPAYWLVRLISWWYVVFGKAPGLVRYFEHVRAFLPAGSDRGHIAAIFYNFAVALVDRLAFLLWGPTQFQYQYEGIEYLTSAFLGEGGAILLGSHHGNMEIVAGNTPRKQRIARLKILRFEAEGDHARTLFASMPPDWRPGIIAINRAEGFSTLSVLRALREGSVIAMHGDRVMDDRFALLDFFGEEARFPTGPYLLSFLARVPIIEVFCTRTGPDSVKVTVHPPYQVTLDRKTPRDDQLQHWTSQYRDRLAQQVKAAPLQWYNFHDFWQK